MENQLKHNIVFTIKSLLIIAILLFNAVKFINYEESANTKTPLIKRFVEIIIVIIIILFIIINLNIGLNLDFNLEVSTYINIFYIFIILTLGIILNNLYYNDYKTIVLTIFITLCLVVLCIIDFTQKNGKISKWLLNSNNDENYEEKSILLLDNGLNYILFFIFLYIFLQIMTHFINKINKTFLKIN